MSASIILAVFPARTFGGRYHKNYSEFRSTGIYAVNNATGSVTAVFQKTDNTATHALTVSIYKNGSQLAPTARARHTEWLRLRLSCKW